MYMNGRDEREIKNEIQKLWANATIQELESIESYAHVMILGYLKRDEE